MKKAVILGLLVVATFTLAALGREIVVTSTADSGTGSFRWALQTARSGDTITFDPAIFPPNNPAMILVKNSLPSIRCGSLTIDASDVGVVLSGSLLRGGEANGIEILSSGNTVRGLQIIDFSGGGIFLAARAQENTIGGDPAVGSGPFGQGNAIGRCTGGIVLCGMQTTDNTVLGNVIGTDATGTEDLGNVDGVGILDGATRNVIGPDNLIAHNWESGVLVDGATTGGNTITQNRIHDNGVAGIRFAKTDASGTISEFFGPLDTYVENGVLQIDSIFPKSPIVTKRSNELKDNRIGDLWSGMWQQPDYRNTFDTNVFGLGLKRIRIAVNSADVATVNWSHPEFWIHPTYDALISTLAEQGHRVRYILSFWDKDNSTSQETLPCERFSSDEDVNRYLEFVRFIVGHFSDRVDAFEIWNEPNVPDCGQSIAVDDYLNLVRNVVPVIREAAPDAAIVVGSVTPLPFLGAQEYLFEILASDVMPLVDGIAWHVGGPSLEYDEWRDYWLAYPSIVREIKETAWANGFHGEFIGDELNWRTPLSPHPFGAEPWVYSPAVAAKYFARGIVMERGLDLTVGLALCELEVLPLMVRAIMNLCTIMAESEPINMPAEVEIETNGPLAYCAFRYPNGDRILAVWTDGIAQDEDHGIPATITFPVLTAGAVTGIDVLHGFEQELVFEVSGEDTIIRDLLIKDYPILIRLSDVTFGPNYEEITGDGFHRLGDADVVPSSNGGGSDRDGDGVTDAEDYCPDWPGSKEANGC